MAKIYIRKLLPFLTPTTNYTNTIPCTTCGDFDECYTFPANSDLLPPLPPPLPPTAIVASPFPSPSSTTFHAGDYDECIIITIIIILAIVIKCYTPIWTGTIRWNRNPRHVPQHDQNSNPTSRRRTDNNPNDIEANRFDPVVDNPIWFITTRGLHPSVINTITVYRYKDGLIDGSDCSVTYQLPFMSGGYCEFLLVVDGFEQPEFSKPEAVRVRSDDVGFGL
ncbi:unnamed protein product [Amaranthus hypochondriacus]